MLSSILTLAALMQFSSASVSIGPAYVPHFIRLTWNPSKPQADAYNVYRGAQGGPYAQLGVALNTAFDDQSAPQGQSCYVVTGVITGKETKFSNEACGTKP